MPITEDKYHIDAKSGCWVWLGSKRGEYGKVYYKGRGRAAHRVAWELWVGPIPEKLLVLHRCDNKPCINIEHLFLGSHQDNVHDKCLKKRHSHGISHGNCKLTEKQVKEIRSTLFRAKHFVKKYGITQSTVSDIRTRTTWKHID